MKLDMLKIAGFRGFNSERELRLHPRLTLIGAPNSYGKTSIAEALEFLFFGVTSKVDQADSKEEYKDSYRNRHFPIGQTAFVEATCVNDDRTTLTIRRTLRQDGASQCFVDGTEVESWPFEAQLRMSATPFVIQHALKELLLVAPSDRFVRFARILGLNDVDAMYRVITSLCTKPEVSLPPKALKYLAGLAQLEDQLANIVSLRPIALSLRKGEQAFDDTSLKARAYATGLTGAAAADLLMALARKRDDLAREIYEGDPRVLRLAADKAAQQLRHREAIELLGTVEFIDEVMALAKQDALSRLQRQADFLGAGLEYLADDPLRCPLCGVVDEGGMLSEHIRGQHAAILAELSTPAEKDVREKLSKRLSTARTILGANWALLRSQTSDLMGVAEPENQKRLRELLAQDESGAADVLTSAAISLRDSELEVESTAEALQNVIEECEGHLKDKTEQIGHAEAVIGAIQLHLNALNNWNEIVDSWADQVLAAADVLRRVVDAKAGTEELSLLSRLLEKPESIRRAVRLKSMLSELKTLRSNAQQSLGEVMELAFDEKLTKSVMRWYEMIRTKGDPDVHFANFSMEKTKTGDYKNARVRIAAKSYGVELASAVSSLSESKLNALGLCVSIASAAASNGPCGFVVVDDPIQSWDAEHEVQFISLVRELVEIEDRQVILLSHRDSWISVVADGCQTVRGIRYTISGYGKDGPQLTERTWMPIDERIKSILQIANDGSCSVQELQRAEADVRVAVCDLTATAVKRKLSRHRDASTLNKKDVRTLLSEMKCPPGLTDRVAATFGNTDDAHHVPTEYEPNRDRIRQYHGALLDLKGWMNN